MTSDPHHACDHDHHDTASPHDHAGHDHADHDHHDHDHGDCDGHSHGFGFGHQHVHAPASFGAAFAIGIALNTAYVAGEALWGVWAHSMSLLADAGHNLSDVLGLAGAWLAQVLATRPSSARFTYGLRRSTILSALANATILLLVTGGIVWESVLRLFSHEMVQGEVISWVALVGIAVNAVTALLFMKGASNDLNIRGAFLHMAADAIMAFSVVIAGLIISFTGYTIIDPIMSLIVSASIVIGTWSLLRHSLDLALDAVPAGIDPEAVQTALLSVEGVSGLHHLHIWAMSTTETALTVHLLCDPTHPVPPDRIIANAAALLRTQFDIAHPTFQLETQPSVCDTHQPCC
ncbi:cation diffusion facilitator family transporter [Gluconobacter kondonii]|uniref:cation diffusion facilitator family transporter n=1 Tax=Gluconobacter kondonii TaxID=941463 RepID=UPI00197FFB54|nr:cation diffusion facilitator family transporter [Gluconobacter kondonii]MBN3865950.1 cation transporter [Gluconobacter kondonii]MBS1076363.1 cation transporter [Gluconobacter kondonii]